MALVLNAQPSFMNSINFPITWQFVDASPPAGDYYLEVQLTDKGGSNDWGTPEKVYFNSDGYAHYNAATKLIQHFGAPDFTYDYADYKTTPSLGQAYSIKYRTVNDGVASSWTQETSFNNFVQATPNLRIRPDYENYYCKDTPVQPCKFLTHFERPTKWRGYPFSLAYIGITGSSYQLLLDYYDSDGNYDSSAPTNIPANSAELFTHLNVTDIPAAKTIEARLINEPVFATTVSELKTVDIEELPCNPFYVRWVNEFGSYDYWMFKDPTFEVSRTEGVRVSKNEWFYQNATGGSEISSVDIKDNVTVGYGNISKDNLKGLQGILRTTSNPQWLQDLASKTWVDLEIVNENISYAINQKGLEDIELSFNFPKIYNR